MSATLQRAVRAADCSPSVLTCVVVLGAVAQVLLLLQDELRQRQAVRHLHGALLVPLEDEVVHGVADCRGEQQVRATAAERVLSGADGFQVAALRCCWG